MVRITKNVITFTIFIGLTPNLFCLIDLTLIFHLVNVATLSLYHSLNPGPEPGADLPDLIGEHVAPGLGDGGLQGLGVRVLAIIEPR